MILKGLGSLPCFLLTIFCKFIIVTEFDCVSVNFVVSGSIPWAGNKKELVVYKQRITSVSDQRFKNADPTFLKIRLDPPLEN